MNKSTKILISNLIEAYKEPSIVVFNGFIELSNSSFLGTFGKIDNSLNNLIDNENKLIIEVEQEFNLKRSIINLDNEEYELIIFEKLDDFEEKYKRYNKILTKLPTEVFAFNVDKKENLTLSFKQGNISQQFEETSKISNNAKLEDILSTFGLSKNIIIDYKTVLKGKNVSHTINVGEKVFRIDLLPFEYDSNGEVLEIIGFAEDISDKAILTKYYEESENRFRLLFERESLCKLIIDAETQEILDANSSAIKTFGYGKNLIGMKFYDINSSLKDQIPYLIDQVLKGEEESIIAAFEAPGGKKRTFEMFLTGMELNDKKVITASLIDISDKLDAEKQLKNYINDIEDKNSTIQNRNEEIQAINEELRVTTEDLEHTLRRLNDKNDNLKAVLDASFDTIIVLNSNFRIIDANQKAENYFGVNKEVLIGQDILKLISDQNRNDIIKLKNQVDEFEIGEIILKNYLYDNKINYAEVRASKFIYEGEEHFIVMLRDISEIMEANRIITETNNKLNFLIKHNPNIIYNIDIIKSEVTFVSENIYEQYGYDPYELLGNMDKTNSLVHPDDLEIVHSSFEKIFDDINSVSDFRLIKKNGDIAWIHNKMVLTTDEDGSQRNIIGTFIDITEKKKVEKELNILNQRFEFILKHSPAVIYTLDPKDNYKTTFTSKNVVEQLGFSHTDFVKNTELWRERIHKDDYEKAVKALELVYEKGYFSHEYRIIDANKNQKWLHDELRVLYNDKKEPIEIIGSVLDVTQLKESEQQLIELNATKDKFFSIIAHDLKSPLSGILNLTGLLVREFDKISIEQMLEISEKLYNTSISFNKLLENLLLWSRISRETVDYDPQKFRLIDFPQEVVQLLDSSIKEKSLDVRIDIPENVFIFVDMNMIDTVFRNLISNSIKFTPRNGKITVTSNIINNDFVEVKIIDNGIGIKPENLNKIFRIEDKLTTRGTAGESGTGLGLIICKEFIQKHNGNIKIESELDKGTIVSFTLPLKN